MKRILILLLLAVSGTSFGREDKEKKALWTWMDTKKDEAVSCARNIWETPELAEKEFKSSARLASYLEENGFTITRGIADIPTAWVAEYRNGDGPVIGYLAEFDALPGLSQAAAEPTRKVLVDGGPGHGCGHNLLGSASAFAAIGVKHAMTENKISGTVRVFGCPAEETLVGKIYMTRAGVFKGVDAMLGWHPGGANAVTFQSSLALTSIKFKFFGRTAHGAGDPHHGRSALDAVELTDIGVNFLREHVIDKARIHYVITSGGGAPNVVPAVAEVWYYVRAPKTEEMRPILERVRDIARGATLMTGTRVEENLLTSGYEVLLNEPLALLLQENLEAVGPPAFDSSDYRFARKLSESFEKEATEKPDSIMPDSTLLVTSIKELKIVPPKEWQWGMGSTDDGDVSWNVPYGRITTACSVGGSPGHSWQVVAAAGSPVGFKGMVDAGKVLAGAGLDLLTKPKWIKEAQADFVKKLDGRTYKCGVPDSLRPPGSR